MLPAVIQDVNISQALLDLNSFLNAHPTLTWKDRPDDTPLRTIKTVLHSLIKLKGHQVGFYLKGYRDSPELATTSLGPDGAQIVVGSGSHRSVRKVFEITWLLSCLFASLFSFYQAS